MFSSAVSVGSRLKNWKTKPMWRRRSLVRAVSPIAVISWSPIQALPEVGRSRPARMCMRVDLPEPDGPITATSSPSADRERDAAEGVDGGVAVAVAADEVAADDDRPGGGLVGAERRSEGCGAAVVIWSLLGGWC